MNERSQLSPWQHFTLLFVNYSQPLLRCQNASHTPLQTLFPCCIWFHFYLFLFLGCEVFQSRTLNSQYSEYPGHTLSFIKIDQQNVRDEQERGAKDVSRFLTSLMTVYLAEQTESSSWGGVRTGWWIQVLCMLCLSCLWVNRVAVKHHLWS